jgi:hypothetical protein
MISHKKYYHTTQSLVALQRALISSAPPNIFLSAERGKSAERKSEKDQESRGWEVPSRGNPVFLVG